MATHSGLHYGTEFVFSYGPLGFVALPLAFYPGFGLLSLIYLVAALHRPLRDPDLGAAPPPARLALPPPRLRPARPGAADRAGAGGGDPGGAGAAGEGAAAVGADPLRPPRPQLRRGRGAGQALDRPGDRRRPDPRPDRRPPEPAPDRRLPRPLRRPAGDLLVRHRPGAVQRRPVHPQHDRNRGRLQHRDDAPRRRALLEGDAGDGRRGGALAGARRDRRPPPVPRPADALVRGPPRRRQRLRPLQGGRRARPTPATSASTSRAPASSGSACPGSGRAGWCSGRWRSR